ncbi:putative ORFan [Tupanvirus deep ocean]|uniref:ORFan n=2 Tax=Tupanvirus TaxID=2094720 RepID=A0AC62A907_9VIRU|nr:putative ORFan [Tupanvirus deep ocean]QKU34247.1 putative ORFan [Tupanvirus deep ocean]
MEDFDEQIKIIRKELHQKYLQYLNSIQQEQQDISNINNNIEELRKDVEEYIDVELDTKENLQPLYQNTYGNKCQMYTSIPTIKENYYDRYGERKIPKIPRSRR